MEYLSCLNVFGEKADSRLGIGGQISNKYIEKETRVLL